MYQTCTTKICLYNFDPLKPLFMQLNWDLQGYILFYVFLLKNIDCGYSLEPPRRGGSNEYPQSMFWAEMWKISELFICNVCSSDNRINLCIHTLIRSKEILDPWLSNECPYKTLIRTRCTCWYESVLDRHVINPSRKQTYISFTPLNPTFI